MGKKGSEGGAKVKITAVTGWVSVFLSFSFFYAVTRYCSTAGSDFYSFFLFTLFSVLTVFSLNLWEKIEETVPITPEALSGLLYLYFLASHIYILYLIFILVQTSLPTLFAVMLVLQGIGVGRSVGRKVLERFVPVFIKLRKLLLRSIVPLLAECIIMKGKEKERMIDLKINNYITLRGFFSPSEKYIAFLMRKREGKEEEEVRVEISEGDLKNIEGLYEKVARTLKKIM